jgi:hypothetical protein
MFIVNDYKVIKYIGVSWIVYNLEHKNNEIKLRFSTSLAYLIVFYRLDATVKISYWKPLGKLSLSGKNMQSPIIKCYSLRRNM